MFKSLILFSVFFLLYLPISAFAGKEEEDLAEKVAGKQNPISAFAEKIAARQANRAARKQNQEVYRQLLVNITGSSEAVDPLEATDPPLVKLKREIVTACQGIFQKKIKQPSKNWTARDHNPANQQSVRIGPFLAFIDEGEVFIKDIRPDINSPLHLGDFSVPLGGPSNVKAIVLLNNEGALAALTEDNKVYRVEPNKPKARKPATWTKINKNVQQIASSETPDGEIALSMSIGPLDPMTGNPL